MSVIPVNLAVEDELSNSVLRTILRHVGRYAVGTTYMKGGFGYLGNTIHGWHAAAQGIPFVVLTDLDDYACPSELIGTWISDKKHPNLLLRVAVREVESWLLADSLNFAIFLGISSNQLPDQCDSLKDPKAVLVKLGAKARNKEIREDIVPRKNSTAKQGPGYNGCLAQFVNNFWNIEFACEKSPSLSRTVARLREFKPKWK